MKKLLILATVLLSSCSAYKIQIVNFAEHDYYVPLERKGLVWDRKFILCYDEKDAREYIEWLRHQYKIREMNRKKRYIKIK
jgi:hypothetical protein